MPLAYSIEHLGPIEYSIEHFYRIFYRTIDMKHPKTYSIEYFIEFDKPF